MILQYVAFAYSVIRILDIYYYPINILKAPLTPI